MARFKTGQCIACQWRELAEHLNNYSEMGNAPEPINTADHGNAADAQMLFDWLPEPEKAEDFWQGIRKLFRFLRSGGDQ